MKYKMIVLAILLSVGCATSNQSNSMAIMSDNSWTCEPIKNGECVCVLATPYRGFAFSTKCENLTNKYEIRTHKGE